MNNFLLLPYLNQTLDSCLLITGILDENRLIKEGREMLWSLGLKSK